MRVLVLHALRHDSRLTTVEHTLSFARHLNGCEVTYVNVFGRVAQDLCIQRFDLVVLTYEMLAQRAMPFWKALTNRIAPVMKNAGIRVVMPQDDYSYSGLLDRFIVDNAVDFVFTPITRDLDKLYPRAQAKGLKFHEALTGYWESDTRLPISTLRKPFKERSTDLGQRVRLLSPHFGRVAERKGRLALEFASLAKSAGFSCDVSTDSADVLVGDAWLQFLGDIRFTVGRRGGASVVDPFGRLQSRVTQLELRKPDITHDEIAKRLKVDQLPQGDFTAISPRLFECAAMGVCQVLEDDFYADGFEAWRDFIPLASDMSNVDDVFAVMRDLDRCEEIALNAEKALIGTGVHSYRQFVKRFMQICVGYDTAVVDSPRVNDLDATLFPVSNQDFAELVQSIARKLVVRNRKLNEDLSSETARQWAACFQRGELILESLTTPWCPATAFLGST